MHYVVFTYGDKGEWYWTGGKTEGGDPKTSRSMSKALRFDKAREAYDAAAGSIEELPQLERFKVGRREWKLLADD